MISPLNLLDRLVERLAGILNGAASVWLFLLTLIIVTDVIGRAAFHRPLTGTPELVKVSLVAIVFLQLAHTLRKERHVRSTIVLSRVSPGVTIVLDGIANLIGLLLFALVFYSSWPLTVTAWKILEYEGEGSLHVPTYPIRTIILLGSALMIVQFGLHLRKNINEGFQIIRRKGD